MLDGLDAMLSIVQMPPGIPVATVAINGALNAGLRAAKMLGAFDDEIMARVEAYSRELCAMVEELLTALEGEDVMNTAYWIMESDETEEYKDYERQRIDYHDIEDEEEHMRLFHEDMALYDRVFNEPWCRMLPEGDNLHHPTADRIAAAAEQVKAA